jgi:hypothetical protein
MDPSPFYQITQLPFPKPAALNTQHPPAVCLCLKHNAVAQPKNVARRTRKDVRLSSPFSISPADNVQYTVQPAQLASSPPTRRVA